MVLTCVATGCCCRYWSIPNPTPWHSSQILPPFCYSSQNTILLSKIKKRAPKSFSLRARTRVEFAIHLDLHPRGQKGPTERRTFAFALSRFLQRRASLTLAGFHARTDSPARSSRSRLDPHRDMSAARSETREHGPPAPTSHRGNLYRSKLPPVSPLPDDWHD